MILTLLQLVEERKFPNKKRVRNFKFSPVTNGLKIIGDVIHGGFAEFPEFLNVHIRDKSLSLPDEN